MPVRKPNLERTLRCFVLGAFALLDREVEDGAELPFAFEEHASLGRPALYEYRTLVRPFVEERSHVLRRLNDAEIALEELRREPAAAIFARAHVGAPAMSACAYRADEDPRNPSATEDDALFRSVLLPLVVSTAEACGGFDWHDESFAHAYLALEGSLFGSERAYAAVAPLVGVSCGAQVDLGNGLRVRAAAAGELSRLWPETRGLLPRDFGREPDRLCVLELERPLGAGTTEPPDAPGEIADAVSALRLATAAPVAAGPVIFERLDWRPYGVRPVLPIAATAPPGEPTRIDQFRGRLAAELLAALPLADGDADLADALDRWELSLFLDEPLRSESLHHALAQLLGGAEATLRAAALLGETGRERAEFAERLREGSPDLTRRALVEALAHGDRRKLIRELDDALLGVRPRPQTYFARLAS